MTERKKDMFSFRALASLTLGLTLHVNIGSMLGMIAAFIIYRKM